MNKRLTPYLVGLFALLSTSFSTYFLMPSGLSGPAAVGKFLNNKLPSVTPGDGQNLTWSVEPAFPNLTFNSPLVIQPHPRQNKIFVASRDGLIEYFDNNQNTTTKQTFIDLRAETGVVWDGGFLGLAFHPDFGKAGSPNRNYFYVYYTAKGPNGEFGGLSCDNTCFSCANNGNFFGSYLRLSRYTVTDGTFTVNKNTELKLFNVRQFNGTHRGGGLNFGMDGFLYLAIGDQARRTTAQDIVTNFEGGVIRIDVDSKGGTISHAPRRKMGVHVGESDEFTGVGYYIPNDNPWLATNNGKFEEFYHNGHRNPHRMTMDRVTGEFWIGEVGAGSREEVTIVKKGHNGGWPVYEGNLFRQFTPCGSNTLPLGEGTYNPPVVDFLRTEANAIIGGYVYRGSKFPSLYGKYICGGYSQNRLFWIEKNSNGTYSKTHFTNFTPGNIITFGEGPDAEIYMGRQANNTTLYTLKASGANPPAPVLLSQTGAFSNLTNLTPSQGMIPYELIESFWSDGADKNRWIAIPNNGTHNTAAEQIQFSENGNWTFPNGTVIVKHFELGGKRLETRFEVKGDDNQFYYLTYKWNAAGTDATLLTTGLDEQITVNGQTQTYHYPSPSECLTCHLQAAGNVLGLRTRFINKAFTYPSTGTSTNQLVALSSIGAINQNITNAATANYITAAAKNDLSKSLELRARSYLDVNCSSCHQPGTGNRAQFDARITTNLAQQNYIDGPVITPLGLTNPALIKAGAVDRSMVHYRLNSLQNGVAMPPISKNKIDNQGVQVIADWINSLGNTGGTVTETCNTNTITHGNGTITLTSGGSATYFKILDGNWGYVANCGWQCGNSFTVNGLAAGQYRVYFENSNYQTICEKVITLGGGGNNDPDNDGDGFLASQDCNDNDPNLTIVGASCNDGNANTINDKVLANCTCAGTPTGGGGTVTETCNDNTITHGNGTITLISGGSASYFKILDGNWGYVGNCGWQCGGSFSLNGLPAGQYRVYFENANYQPVCEKVITLGGGGNNDPDNDGDGFPASQDCNDNDPNLTVVGANCNDGNANTTNDKVLANCTCAGTPTGGGGTVTEDCSGNTITHGNGTITLTSGGNASFYQILNANWAPVDHCGWNCGTTFSVSNLPTGRYLIYFQNASYATICQKWIDLTGSSTAAANSSNRNAPQFNFTAFKAARAVDLQWVSNTGYINDYFVVEKSVDGKNFTALQTINNTSVGDDLDFNDFVDETPVLGINYYRIKQVYRDGWFDYSPIQPVDFAIDLNQWAIYPNPAQEAVFVNLKTFAGKKGTLHLVNNFGQIIQSKTIDNINEETFQWSLKNIPNGFYAVMVQIEGERLMQQKLMVERLY